LPASALVKRAWTEAILLPIAAALISLGMAQRASLLDRPFLIFLAVAIVAYRHPGRPAWATWAIALMLVALRPWIPGLPRIAPPAATVQAVFFALTSAATVLLMVRARTVRERHVHRMREEVDRFRMIMTNSPEGIWRLSGEGRTLEVNRRMGEMLGYEPLEMVGRHFLEFTSGEGGRVAENAFERAARGEPMQFESMFLTRGGLPVWTLVTTHPILDSTGALVEAFAILRDITERHRIESERQAAISLLEATLDATTDGVLVVDRNGKIIRFNERFVALWRIPKDVIQSRDDQRAIATVLSQLQDPEAFVARVSRLYANPDAESHDVLRFKDGRVFERSSRPQRIRGEVVGRVWSFRDVTDREHALAEQRLAAAREATIARNLDSALFTFVLGADERVERYEYFSLGAEGLFGIPLEELLQDPSFWHGRVHPEDREIVVRPTLRGLLRLEPAMIEFRYESSKGIYRWHRTRFYPRREADGRVHVDGIETDVTDRVALEEQLRHAQKLEAVGQLAGGIAHDFNNILTAVIGYADLLLTRMGPNDPDRHAVEEIHKGGDRAASLTRQLLAFGRRSTAQPRRLNLNSVLRDLVPMLQRLAGEHIGFDVDLSPETGEVRVDPSQFEQVVINLVVNARDAMPDGGTMGIATDRVLVSPAEARGDAELAPGAYARLRVSDTGTGIDPDAFGHIFEPFFTTKGHGRGNGLGLATVYGIVSQHRGRVRAANRDTSGAEFEILLPEVTSTEAAAVAVAAPGSFPGGAESILFVEDDPALLALGQEVLTELGYRVQAAPTGVEALRLLQEGSPEVDILVTDVVMPGMGGRELAERACANRPELRVLYVSGYPKDSVLREEIEEAEIAFLEKPYTPLVLARRVREALNAPPRAAKR
jgi:two-component system cell cycle sensor histidine kinase/response regulator CckA